MNNSPYLDQPVRSEAEFSRQNKMRILDEMIERFTLDAIRLQNSPDNADVAFAYKLKDRVSAIKWLMLEAFPTTEGPRQILDEISKAAE